MTMEGLARSFSVVNVKILNSSSHPKFEAELDRYVAEGAEPRALNYELGAFAFFCVWSGAVRAMQVGKRSQAELEEFVEIYQQQIASEVDALGLDLMCRVNRRMKCMDFLDERFSELASITVEVDSSLVLSTIVDTVCGWFGRVDAPIGLKLMVKTQYLLDSGTAFDLISKPKLVKSP